MGTTAGYARLLNKCMTSLTRQTLTTEDLGKLEVAPFVSLGINIVLVAAPTQAYG